jgi:hypothetical protein
MTQWGNFAITHVRYNENHTRIVQVRRRTYENGHLINPEIKTRAVIVDSINKNYSYVTSKYVNDKWMLGDTVIAYPLGGEYFIRTDGNKTTADNLGELPEF